MIKQYKKLFSALIALFLVLAMLFGFGINKSIYADSTENTAVSMTVTEIMNLGEQKKLEFQKLYFDFLSHNFSGLVFGRSQKYLNYEDTYYIAVESSEFLSVDDLYNYFLNFCTPEYSKELITDSRNFYRDIEGKLYLTDTMLTDGTISFDGSTIDSYEVAGNKIIFKCTGLSDDTFALDYDPDNPIHHAENDIAITFVLKNVDDIWLIDSCSNIDLFLT